MKRIFIPVFILLLTVFILSCDDSFLEENKEQHPVYQLNTPLLVEPTTQFTEVSITLDNLQSKDFKVIQYPQFIHFESFKGRINDTGELTLRIKIDTFDETDNVGLTVLGSIVLDVSGYGLLAIPVAYLNIGDPAIILTPAIISGNGESHYIDFGPSYGEEKFSIGANYSGVLVYQITDYPSWITFSPSNNSDVNDVVILNPYETVDYMISVNREGLVPGYYEGAVTIMSNDTHKPVKKLKVSMIVRDQATTRKIIPIDGSVKDCVFDRQTGRLYLVTQNPNRVKIIDVASYTENEISLTNDATSVSLSENRENLLVGQAKMLSVFNLSDLTLKKNIPLEFDVEDVIDGLNGFYYLSNKIIYVNDFGTNHLFQYDISQDKLSKIIANGLSGGNMIKLKDSPYLLTTCNNTSPEGLYLIDISNESTAAINYWHQDLGEKLWQFENGKYIVGQRGTVFETPDVATGSDIEVLSYLKPYGVRDNYYDPSAFKWFEVVSATESIWGVYYGSYSMIEYGYNYPQLLEWDLNSFRLKRNVSFSDFQTIIEGENKLLSTIPYYVFSNTTRNELLLIKNVLHEHYLPEVDRWHLEIIDISN